MELPCEAGPLAPRTLLGGGVQKVSCLRFSMCACHPCAGAMLIFSASFQFQRMVPEGNPGGGRPEIRIPRILGMRHRSETDCLKDYRGNHRDQDSSLLRAGAHGEQGTHRAPTAPPSEASSSPSPGQPVPIGFEARVGTKWSEVETLWSTADSGEGSKRFEFLFRHWANPRPPTNL